MSKMYLYIFLKCIKEYKMKKKIAIIKNKGE